MRSGFCEITSSPRATLHLEMFPGARQASDRLLSADFEKLERKPLLKVRIADFITGMRILISIALLLCPAFSASFFILYLACGLTDMVDGPVARKTGTADRSGAKLDTAADLVFVAVCLWKLLPILDVPMWLWIWIALIALIKVINIVSGYMIGKQYVAVHTIMNKVAGILLFLLPLTLSAVELEYSAFFVCAVATFAAIQEGHYIRTGRDGL